MVGSNASGLNFNFLGFSVLFSSLRVVFIIFVGVLFSLNLQRSEESVLIGQQQFCVVVIIESMHYFFVAFMEPVKLKRFCGGILVEKFGVVLDQPFCTSIAVENNDMFLSKDK